MIDPQTIALTFDRSADVSKLKGCNTRGIAYRWEIFAKYLSGVSIGASVLDFGAGSLRESFDLVQRGFRVTSIDVDGEALSTYRKKYNWPADAQHQIIAHSDLSAAASELGDRRFELIICFDVLEHLADPVSSLRELSSRLHDRGLMFVSVPNGRTLFEIAFRIDLFIAQTTGRPVRPGEPHLQRHSPRKWRRLVADAGLSILDHDMQIGFFANTAAALIQLPLTLGGRIARRLGIQNNAVGLSERIIDRGPQANILHFLDQHTKPLFGGLYGWNLLVLSKRAFDQCR